MSDVKKMLDKVQEELDRESLIAREKAHAAAVQLVPLTLSSSVNEPDDVIVNYVYLAQKLEIYFKDGTLNVEKSPRPEPQQVSDPTAPNS